MAAVTLHRLIIVSAAASWFAFVAGWALIHPLGGSNGWSLSGPQWHTTLSNALFYCSIGIALVGSTLLVVRMKSGGVPSPVAICGLASAALVAAVILSTLTAASAYAAQP